MRQNDTIVAISTPSGVGGIAVVRLSGPDSLSLTLKHLSVKSLDSRHATYCRFDDLDDVVTIWYPSGYSGEPTVEIACHGSRFIQQAIIQALCESGARLADPGEFTLRAFRNGRLNLSQAEAVADLIEAATPAQHRLAVSQLRGGYAQQLRDMRSQLIDLASLLELELDFSEEDLEFADRQRLKDAVDNLDSNVTRLLSSFQNGNALKNGIPVAIVGRPNSGKSTLLNALLNDDRAMVSDVPGTTRDTIEEAITIDGLTFRFIDTAGLRDSTDQLEAMGIERTIKAVEQARILLILHDIQVPINDFLSDFNALKARCNLADKAILTIHNKCDLSKTLIKEGIDISAKNGEGINELKQTLVQTARDTMMTDNDVMLTNARHFEELKAAKEALNKVNEGLTAKIPADLLAVDLRDALEHLGAITGETTSNDLLANIFSRFCIGK